MARKSILQLRIIFTRKTGSKQYFMSELNQNQRTSDLLKDIAAMHDQGSISVGKFVEMLGDRSFALSMLIFSLPNSLPVPGIPGFSTITGIPILLIAVQIIIGRQSIWLPAMVADKEFQQATIAKIVTKALPIIVWLEKFIRPRYSVMSNSIAERLIGFMVFLMAAILSLPVVGGNFLPGFSISLMALALLEKDGIFVIFSVLFTAASIYGMVELVSSALGWLIGLL